MEETFQKMRFRLEALPKEDREKLPEEVSITIAGGHTDKCKEITVRIINSDSSTEEFNLADLIALSREKRRINDT